MESTTLLTAEDLVARIAPDEAAYLANPEVYSGFVRKSRKRVCVDFVWCGGRKPEELTVNKHGVICSRTLLDDGKTWYGYTLSPFGEGVPFSVECKAARLMLTRFLAAR